MEAKKVKNTIFFYFALFLLLLVNCTGEIEGELTISEESSSASTISLDEWIPDTPHIAICLAKGGEIITNDEGELMCVIEELDYSLLEMSGDDTIQFHFDDLKFDTYYIGFYVEYVDSVAGLTKELVSWYRSDLDTFGAALNFSDAEAIPVSFFNKHVDVGITRFYYDILSVVP